MEFKATSEVIIGGIIMKHEHTQEFADDSNVFGRVLEYHEYMHKTFPRCQFRLIDAKLIEGKKK